MFSSNFASKVIILSYKTIFHPNMHNKYSVTITLLLNPNGVDERMRPQLYGEMNPNLQILMETWSDADVTL